MLRRPSRPFVAAAAALLTVAPVAACGSDRDSSSTPSIATDRVDVADDSVAPSTSNGDPTATAASAATTSGERASTTTSIAASTTSITTSTTSIATSTTTTPTGPVVPEAGGALPSLLVSATVDGDAVLTRIAGDGSTTSVVLWDGPSPAEAAAGEDGPGLNTLDHVSVAPDGSVAYVGTCCEPISGAFYETEPPRPIDLADPTPGIGYNPSVSPDGSLLAVGSTFGFPISFRDRSSGDPVEWDGARNLPDGLNFFTPYDSAWLDDRTAVVLGISESADGIGWAFISATISGSAVEPGHVVPVAGPDEFADVGDLTFGGVLGDGGVVVHESGRAVSRLFRLDGTELSDGVRLDAPARSVWFEDGVAPIVVDTDGRLTVGDVAIDGTHVWARG